MSERPWYIDWFNSPFYHKLYFERDEKEAQAFISRLTNYLKPDPGTYMLDIACGRGRHSRILANKGFAVTGIDISPDSILFAKESERDNLEFYQHDMRLPFRINYYDYALNLFTSFGYFRTRRENDDAIRTIAQSLKPGGEFVLDYLNVHYAEEHLVHNETKIIDNTNYEIHRWQDDTHFYKRIIITDPPPEKEIEFTERVAKFSFGDLNDMLSFEGLQVQQLFGNYQLEEYHVNDTPRLIIVSKKRG